MRIYLKSIVIAVFLLAAISASKVSAQSLDQIRSSIADIEASEGAFSIRLYAPLRQLGIALQQVGAYEEAIRSFRQMQHLVHRNAGVYAPEQMESIQLMINSYIETGSFDQADTQHHFLYRVAAISFDENVHDMHVARARLANWYRLTGRLYEALDLYEESRHLLEERSDAPEDLLAILREEALTMYMAGKCCASDRLDEVVRLADENSLVDREDLRQIFSAHADMLMLERNPAAAAEVYASTSKQFHFSSAPRLLGLHRPEDVLEAHREATMRHPNARVIDLAGDDRSIIFRSSREEPLRAVVGTPVPVCSSAIAEMSISRKELASLYLDIELTVDESGRADEISVSGNTPKKLERYVRTVLHHSRYRPSISPEGALAPGKIAFRQTFSDEPGHYTGSEVSRWNDLLVTQACKMSAKSVI